LFDVVASLFIGCGVGIVKHENMLKLHFKLSLEGKFRRYTIHCTVFKVIYVENFKKFENYFHDAHIQTKISLADLVTIHDYCF